MEEATFDSITNKDGSRVVGHLIGYDFKSAPNHGVGPLLHFPLYLGEYPSGLPTQSR